MVDVVSFPYNEFKFLVTDPSLRFVIDVLESLHGGSDPYPDGIVDSIYYDTSDEYFYNQCLNGENRKRKFRIRGYGDGFFQQLQMKDKDLTVIRKLKDRIQGVQVLGHDAPLWYQLVPEHENTPMFTAIMTFANQAGIIIPSIRVRYHRRRYRINDYRLTLDTHIEVMSFANGLETRFSQAILPNHVLEIKTADPRPYLPLLGLTKLPQVSFSKFFMGLNLLKTGDIQVT
ncbi:MAG: VTC domain-containing protein [Oligoflexus sp.]|nr:VTC domain-containing protein [Oligoflexus sp.]